MKQSTTLITYLASFLFLTLLSCAERETEQRELTNSVVGIQIQDVTPEEAQDLLKKNNAPQVIDIRTLEEFSVGHLPGAIMIDFKSPQFKAALSRLDPNKDYLFHCQSGGRSTKSLDTWKELKLQKIYHLKEGYLSWTKAGYVTE